MNERNNNRKKQPVDLSHMVYGKMPPQAKELEQAVLGAILLEKRVYGIVAEILQPECFYVDAHQLVFRAMKNLASKSQPIDMLTVVEELRSMEALEGIGGPYFITQLTNIVVSSANVVAHARIVREKWRKREAIRIGSEAVSAAYEDDTDSDEVLAAMDQDLRRLTSDGIEAEIRPIQDVVVDVVRDIQELRDRPEQEVTGIPTGYPSLDKLTYGWQDGDLIILAARPGKGKSALAVQLARNAVVACVRDALRKRKGAGVFELEMSDRQLVQRMLAAEARMYLGDIRRGRLDDAQMTHLYQEGIQKVAQMPIWIVEKPNLPLANLCAMARRMVAMGAGMIVVDYLQLVDGKGGDNRMIREQEISTISRTLKGLAKELKVPVIALSQVGRDVEKRGDKEPGLADLRESGAIEQDADVVAFIYEDNEGRTIVKISKNRQGEQGSVPFHFIKAQQRFEEHDGNTPVQAAENAGARPSAWRMVGTNGSYLNKDADNAF